MKAQTDTRSPTTETTRRLMHYQADQIERLLWTHGVSATVIGGVATARLLQYHLLPAPGVRLARVAALADELALGLGVPNCRIFRQAEYLSIEVPKGEVQTVHLAELAARLGRLPPMTALLGQDESGVALLLRLTSPDVVHTLISGTTGSGKTELLRTMLVSLVENNPPDALRLLLIDPKGRAFQAFVGLPHLVCAPVREPAEAWERLRGLVAEMERRDRAGQTEPRIVVVLDELADLFMAGGKAIPGWITRVSQRGREAGIHLIACTQKPAASLIGSLMKSNFPARLVGAVSSADDARVASGVAGSGAEKLQGRGDFILVVKGEVKRFQAAYVGAKELAERLQPLRQIGEESVVAEEKRVSHLRVVK